MQSCTCRDERAAFPRRSWSSRTFVATARCVDLTFTSVPVWSGRQVTMPDKDPPPLLHFLACPIPKPGCPRRLGGAQGSVLAAMNGRKKDACNQLSCTPAQPALVSNGSQDGPKRTYTRMMDSPDNGPGPAMPCTRPLLLPGRALAPNRRFVCPQGPMPRRRCTASRGSRWIMDPGSVPRKQHLAKNETIPFCGFFSFADPTTLMRCVTSHASHRSHLSQRTRKERDPSPAYIYAGTQPQTHIINTYASTAHLASPLARYPGATERGSRAKDLAQSTTALVVSRVRDRRRRISWGGGGG